MQDVADRVRAFMDLHKLSQAQVALAAGVNQATVSRVLRRHPLRHSAALVKLCNYAGVSSTESEGLSLSGSASVVRAFEEVWDGSEAHAISIARIIEATRGLLPERTTHEE